MLVNIANSFYKNTLKMIPGSVVLASLLMLTSAQIPAYQMSGLPTLHSSQPLALPNSQLFMMHTANSILSQDVGTPLQPGLLSGIPVIVSEAAQSVLDQESKIVGYNVPHVVNQQIFFQQPQPQQLVPTFLPYQQIRATVAPSPPAFTAQIRPKFSDRDNIRSPKQLTIPVLNFPKPSATKQSPKYVLNTVPSKTRYNPHANLYDDIPQNHPVPPPPSPTPNFIESVRPTPASSFHLQPKSAPIGVDYVPAMPPPVPTPAQFIEESRDQQIIQMMPPLPYNEDYLRFKPETTPVPYYNSENSQASKIEKPFQEPVETNKNIETVKPKSKSKSRSKSKGKSDSDTSNSENYYQTASYDNHFQNQGYSNSYTSNNAYANSPVVHKHIFVHSAPETYQKPRQVRVIRPQIKKEKHVNIIFVKSPTPEPEPETVVELPQEEPAKTFVYILNKQPQEPPKVKIIGPKPTKPLSPEIFFIRYGTKHEGNKGYPVPNLQSLYNDNYGASTPQFMSVMTPPPAPDGSSRYKRNKEYGLDVYAPLSSYSNTGQINEITQEEADLRRTKLDDFF